MAQLTASITFDNVVEVNSLLRWVRQLFSFTAEEVMIPVIFIYLFCNLYFLISISNSYIFVDHIHGKLTNDHASNECDCSSRLVVIDDMRALRNLHHK